MPAAGCISVCGMQAVGDGIDCVTVRSATGVAVRLPGVGVVDRFTMPIPAAWCRASDRRTAAPGSAQSSAAIDGEVLLRLLHAEEHELLRVRRQQVRE